MNYTERLRRRYQIMVKSGVKPKTARLSRTSTRLFKRAMVAVGADPLACEDLTSPLPGGHTPRSMTLDAVKTRENYAALRKAGLEPKHARLWAHGRSSTEYALRQIAEGRVVPERPGRRCASTRPTDKQEG